MKSEQQVARSFAALGGGEAVSRLIAFAATVYLARVLGAEDYAVIAFAMGVNLYLTKIADFGIEAVGTHEVARNSGSLPRLVSAIMGARIALTCIVVLFAVIAAQALAPDPERTVLSLYFVTLIPIAANIKWVHLGRGNTRAVGLTRVIGEAIGLGIVIATVHGISQLWLVPVAQLVGETAVVAMLYGLLVRMRLGIVFRLRWDPAVALPVFRRALPLLAQIMLGLVLYNSDLIFLRFMEGNASVGFYAAAYTLISFLVNLGMAYCISLLPVLTRLGANTDGERALYQTAFVHIFAVTFPIAIGGQFLASEIIGIAFGPGYLSATPVMQMLIWAVPFSTFRAVPWAAFVARSCQNLLLRATVYAAAVNVLLNITLIHYLGMMGAAVATVLTESMIFFLTLYYGVQQGLGSVPLARFLKPTLAALVMAIALAILDTEPFLVRFAAGVGAYGMALVLFGGIRLRRHALPALEL